MLVYALGVMAAEPRYISTAPLRSADAGHITRLEIVFKTDPFADLSLRTLRNVREMLQVVTAPGQPLETASAIGLAGFTSEFSDLNRARQSVGYRS